VRWLYEQWHALAQWAANQPVYIQLVVGTTTLILAYCAFALTLFWLLRLPGDSSNADKPDPAVGTTSRHGA
jgi:hypothetical protein